MRDNRGVRAGWRSRCVLAAAARLMQSSKGVWNKSAANDEPGALLLRDHARLDALFVELLEWFEEANEDAVRSTWTELDDGLLAHFDLEERRLLPMFANFDPAAAALLLKEHAQIRQLLADLGVAIELHLVPPELARDFIDMLRAHAAREEQLFYRWAGRGRDRRHALGGLR